VGDASEGRSGGAGEGEVMDGAKGFRVCVNLSLQPLDYLYNTTAYADKYSLRFKIKYKMF
jgi:hypothetical protein